MKIFLLLAILCFVSSLAQEKVEHLNCKFYSGFIFESLCLISDVSNLNRTKYQTNYEDINHLVVYSEKRNIFNYKLSIENCSQIYQLTFGNFKGFNLNQNSFESIRIQSIRFINSDFNFLFASNQSKKFFENVEYQLNFESDVKYTENVSVSIFSGANMSIVRFDGLLDTKLKKNILSFNKTENQTSGNQIETLVLSMFKYKLRNNILNEFVFANTKSIFILNYVESIQSDVFKKLKNLKELKIQVISLAKFFKSGTKWMQSLNDPIRIDLNNLTNLNQENKFILTMSQTSSLEKKLYHIAEYTYPNEDFCLFSNFPHDHFVVPNIKTSACTCTALWLIQYNIKLGFLDYEFKNVCSDYEIENCKYFQALKSCNPSLQSIDNNSGNIDKMYAYYDDFLLNLQNDFILSIIAFPATNLIGFLTNMLSICVFLNKKFKLQIKERVYIMILVCVIFNTLSCFINLFQLMIKCVDPISSYCPSYIIDNKVIRYILIIWIFYFGNVLKTSSNYVQLLILIEHLLVVANVSSKTENNTLRYIFIRLKKMKLKLILSIVLLIASLINVVKIFEYEFDLFLIKGFRYPFANANMYNKEFAYFYLNILYLVLNEFLVYALLITFIVSIPYLIQKRFKGEPKDDSIDKTDENNSPLNVNLSKLILITSLFIFLFNLPKSLLEFYIQINFTVDDLTESKSEFNKFNAFNIFYMDCADIFSSISYVLNFFIYFSCLKKFRETFKKLYKFI